MGKMPKNAYASIGGIAVGVISVFCSFALFFARVGSFVAKNTYGGDAYTGIQNAAAATGNNVNDLAAICSKGFGFILLIIGLALICFFLHQLLSEIEPKGSSKPLAGGDVKEANTEVAEQPIGEAINQPEEESTEAEVEATRIEEGTADVNPGQDQWTCECGYTSDGTFCPQCGKPKVTE